MARSSAVDVVPAASSRGTGRVSGGGSPSCANDVPRGKAKDWAEGLGKGLMVMAALAGAVCTGFQFLPLEAEREAKLDAIAQVALVDKPEQWDFQAPLPWFHEGQRAAWALEEEVILILAGRQSGKTTIGAPWLAREIQRRGPGDYGFNGPTLELLKKKALPEFLKFFLHKHRLGTYSRSDRTFTFSEKGLLRMFGTLDKEELFDRYALRGDDGGIVEDIDLFDVGVTIYVGYATKPESLESATFKGVWSDESGQPDFKLESNEALQGRRSVHKARHLHTTTPYDLGWQFEKLFTPCLDAGPREGDPEWVVGRTADIAVARFESWMNPAFGMFQFKKIQASGLAEWKFKLFYRAIYTRPAGMVYDVFDETLHTFKGRIPPSWPRAIGNDFGTRNMAALKLACDPDDPDPDDPTLYVYGVYCPGSGKSTEQHVESILLNEPFVPPAVGGAGSEDDWRADFGANGLYIEKPSVIGLDAQIGTVYGKFYRGKLKILKTLPRLIKEVQQFSYQLDEQGEPIPGKFRDEQKFHRLACLRYVVSEIDHDPTFILGSEDDATDLGYGDEETEGVFEEDADVDHAEPY